jgi:hypothetical protein
MRTLKTLWRLAVDKGLGPKTRRKDTPQRQPGPTPGTLRDTARLLDDEPPTRTLQ